jgi:hypothetical protein
MLMKLMDMKQPLTSDTIWCTEVKWHDCEIWRKLQQCYFCTSHLLKIHSIVHIQKDGVLCIMKMNSENSDLATARMCLHHNSVRAYKFKYQVHSVHPHMMWCWSPLSGQISFKNVKKHKHEMNSLPELKKLYSGAGETSILHLLSSYSPLRVRWHLSSDAHLRACCTWGHSSCSN